MNWEATALRPILTSFYATQKNVEDLKNAIRDENRILAIVNQSQPVQVSASEIVLWCDLYPVWIDRPEVINSIPRIKTWMERLNGLESFKSGLGEIFKGKQKNIQWNFSTWYKKASDGSGSNATKRNTEEPPPPPPPPRYIPVQ